MLSRRGRCADKADGSNTKAKEEAVVRKLACLAVKKDATDKAAGSHAIAAEEANVGKLACLVAKKDAAEAKEEAAAEEPSSAVESTLKMNRLKARSMD